MIINKHRALITIVLVLVVVTFMPALPSVAAAPANVETLAFLALSPNPTGLNQSVGVSVWVVPIPPTTKDVFHGFQITITKPGETVETIGPLDSSLVGSRYFTFTPDRVGKYYFQLTYPGETFANGTTYYMPATSPKTELIVQEQHVPDYPETPLPTDYWDRPISGMNREWWSISGNWLMRGYNATYRAFDSVAAFNPYTAAPESAHVVWTKELALGGLVGGESGSKSYFSGLSYETKLNPPVIINGRLYYNMYPATLGLPGFVCVDLRTGEELWRNTENTITCAQLYNYVSGNETGIAPYLWSIGSTYKMFDAFTGELILSFANASKGTVVYSDDGTMLVYVCDGVSNWLTRWNSTKAFDENGMITWSPNNITLWGLKTGTFDWRKGIEWNVTTPQWNVTASGMKVTQTIQTIADDSILTFVGAPNDLRFHICYSAKTGEQLWAFDRTDGNRQYPPLVASGEGVYVQFDPTHGQYIAYSLATGSQLWVSDALEYPWGGYSLSSTIAYDKLYSLDLAGYVTAFDIKTGKRLWHFFSGNSGIETHYGAYAFFWGPLVAGEVVFAATGEHSPSQPLSRGQRLFAIDANTANSLWNITGMMAVQAIADGYLLVYNAYDNRLYCFGKGQTSTTVSVTKSQIGKGESVGITGTITDQSPAQKDSPCISKDSMSVWMEYLLMQQPRPANVTGVPVKLQAIRSDNTVIALGQITSDPDGVFRFKWTPPDEDLYKIRATFEGDGSYGSSYATTTLMVDLASPTEEPTYIATILAIIASIVVALVIGIVSALALKRRK
jgi:hypothetical protein